MKDTKTKVEGNLWTLKLKLQFKELVQWWDSALTLC